MSSRCSALLIALLLSGCRAPAVGPELEALSAAEGAAVDPLPVLEDAAGSLDVSARGRALDLLIRYAPTPGGGPWGGRALFDPQPYVQGLAVDALAARVAEPESAALLAGVAGRSGADPYVRGAAAFELALAGAPLPALDTDGLSYWERAPLSLALARAGDAGALADLQRSLALGELPLELGFFEDIGRSGLTALAPSLIEGSGRVEEELVLPIALALVRLGSARGESMFRAALASPDTERRLEALDYLADERGPEADALLHRARAQGPDSVRQYAQLIQFARGGGKPDAVWSALDSPDRERRLLAVQAMGERLAACGAPEDWRRVDEQLHAALRASLGDPEAAVVMASLQALAAAGSPADRVTVAPLLSRDPLVLRVEAAGALLALVSPG